MPSQARAAYKNVFKIGADTVPEVISVSDLGARADLADVTSRDGNGYDSQLPTIKRNNPIRVMLNYIPGNAIQEGFEDEFNNGTIATYSETIPGPPQLVYTIQGRVSAWQLQPLGVANAVQVEAIINPDGPITRTVTP